MNKVKVLDAESIDGGLLLTTGKEYDILSYNENEIEITHNLYANIRQPFVISSQDFRYIEVL